jgi:hypothetical protein
VLEGCRRNDFQSWIPRAVVRVAPQETEVTFTIGANDGIEMFRVRGRDGSASGPFYAGTTDFPEPATDPAWMRGGSRRSALAAS